MYQNIDELISDFKNESNATVRIFEALTDESLNQTVIPDGRSLGKIAWHITNTIPELLNHIGFNYNTKINEFEVPDKVNLILDTYKVLAEQTINLIKTNLTDEDLKKEVNLYGDTCTIDFAFTMLIRHEIHHRAQITILMRQAGLKVPGLYGPSKEEWQQMGKEPLP